MIYTALFRGINVGGKHIVKMDNLKKMFADAEFNNIQTYIQSGNVVFSSDLAPEAAVKKIQEAFVSTFGFESAVMLRTGDEIAGIIDNLPFSAQEIRAAEAANGDVEHLYVYMLDEAPPRTEIEKLCAANNTADSLRVGNKEIYLLCHNSVRDSRLAASLTRLKVSMTARNWKTMNKLHEIIKKNSNNN